MDGVHGPQAGGVIGREGLLVQSPSGHRAGLFIQSALRAKIFQKISFFRFFSAFWLGTSTERNVRDVEIYRLSKFQVRTTLGGRKNAEKRKSIFFNFAIFVFRRFFVRQASYRPETLTIDRSRRP